MSTPRAITRRTLACRATPTSPSSALKGSDEMKIRRLGMMGEDGRRTGIFNMCHLDFALWPSASLFKFSVASKLRASVLSTPRAAAPGHPRPPPPPLRPGSRPPQKKPPPAHSLHANRPPAESVREGGWDGETLRTLGFVGQLRARRRVLGTWRRRQAFRRALQALHDLFAPPVAQRRLGQLLVLMRNGRGERRGLAARHSG